MYWPSSFFLMLVKGRRETFRHGFCTDNLLSWGNFLWIGISGTRTEWQKLQTETHVFLCLFVFPLSEVSNNITELVQERGGGGDIIILHREKPSRQPPM